MKFNYKCPKCNSNDVLMITGTKYNTQHTIPLTKWSIKNAALDRYICANCGYTEEYVQLDSSFEKFARKNLGKQNRKGRIDDEYV